MDNVSLEETQNWFYPSFEAQDESQNYKSQGYPASTHGSYNQQQNTQRNPLSTSLGQQPRLPLVASVQPVESSQYAQTSELRLYNQLSGSTKQQPVKQTGLIYQQLHVPIGQMMPTPVTAAQHVPHFNQQQQQQGLPYQQQQKASSHQQQQQGLPHQQQRKALSHQQQHQGLPHQQEQKAMSHQQHPSHLILVPQTFHYRPQQQKPQISPQQYQYSAFNSIPQPIGSSQQQIHHMSQQPQQAKQVNHHYHKMIQQHNDQQQAQRHLIQVPVSSGMVSREAERQYSTPAQRTNLHKQSLLQQQLQRKHTAVPPPDYQTSLQQTVKKVPVSQATPSTRFHPSPGNQQQLEAPVFRMQSDTSLLYNLPNQLSFNTSKSNRGDYNTTSPDIAQHSQPTGPQQSYLGTQGPVEQFPGNIQYTQDRASYPYNQPIQGTQSYIEAVPHIPSGMLPQQGARHSPETIDPHIQTIMANYAQPQMRKRKRDSQNPEGSNTSRIKSLFTVPSLNQEPDDKSILGRWYAQPQGEEMEESTDTASETSLSAFPVAETNAGVTHIVAGQGEINLDTRPGFPVNTDHVSGESTMPINLVIKKKVPDTVPDIVPELPDLPTVPDEYCSSPAESSIYDENGTMTMASVRQISDMSNTPFNKHVENLRNKHEVNMTNKNVENMTNNPDCVVSTNKCVENRTIKHVENISNKCVETMTNNPESVVSNRLELDLTNKQVNSTTNQQSPVILDMPNIEDWMTVSNPPPTLTESAGGPATVSSCPNGPFIPPVLQPQASGNTNITIQNKETDDLGIDVQGCKGHIDGVPLTKRDRSRGRARPYKRKGIFVKQRASGSGQQQPIPKSDGCVRGRVRSRGRGKARGHGRSFQHIVERETDVESITQYLDTYSEDSLKKNSITLETLKSILDKMNPKSKQKGEDRMETEEPSTSYAPGSNNSVFDADNEGNNSKEPDSDKVVSGPENSEDITKGVCVYIENVDSDMVTRIDSVVDESEQLTGDEMSAGLKAPSVDDGGSVMPSVETTEPKTLVVKLPKLSPESRQGKERTMLKPPSARKEIISTDNGTVKSLSAYKKTNANTHTIHNEQPSRETVKSPISSKGKSPLSSKGKSPISSKGKSPISSKGKSPLSSKGKSPIPSKGKSPISRKGKSPISSKGKTDMVQASEGTVTAEMEETPSENNRAKMYKIDDTHKYTAVKFHGQLVLLLLTPNGRFFLTSELLRRCFSCGLKGKSRKEKILSKNRTLEIKEKVLKIPFIAMDMAFHRIVERYFIKWRFCTELQPEVSIISEENAKTLFHYIYEDKYCEHGCVIFDSEASESTETLSPEGETDQASADINGPLKPGPSRVNADLSDVKPGTSGMKSGPSGVKPGTGGVKPGASGAKPGTSGIKSGPSGVKSGTSGVKPGPKSVKPGTSGVKPGPSGVKPGTSGVKPGPSDAKEGTNVVKPGPSGVKQVTSVVKPGTSGVKSGPNGVKGAISIVKPGPSGAKPGSSGVKPSSSGVKPSSDVVKPGSGDVHPDSIGVKQGSSGVKPGSSGAKPGTSGVKQEPSGVNQPYVKASKQITENTNHNVEGTNHGVNPVEKVKCKLEDANVKPSSKTTPKKSPEMANRTPFKGDRNIFQWISSETQKSPVLSSDQWKNAHDRGYESDETLPYQEEDEDEKELTDTGLVPDPTVESVGSFKKPEGIYCLKGTWQKQTGDSEMLVNETHNSYDGSQIESHVEDVNMEPENREDVITETDPASVLNMSVQNTADRDIKVAYLMESHIDDDDVEEIELSLDNTMDTVMSAGVASVKQRPEIAHTESTGNEIVPIEMLTNTTENVNAANGDLNVSNVTSGENRMSANDVQQKSLDKSCSNETDTTKKTPNRQEETSSRDSSLHGVQNQVNSGIGNRNSGKERHEINDKHKPQSVVLEKSTIPNLPKAPSKLNLNEARSRLTKLSKKLGHEKEPHQGDQENRHAEQNMKYASDSNSNKENSAKVTGSGSNNDNAAVLHDDKVPGNGGSDTDKRFRELGDTFMAGCGEFVNSAEEKLQALIDRSNDECEMTDMYRELNALSKPMYKWSIQLMESYKKSAEVDKDYMMLRDFEELERAHRELENNHYSLNDD